MSLTVLDKIKAYKLIEIENDKKLNPYQISKRSQKMPRSLDLSQKHSQTRKRTLIV